MTPLKGGAVCETRTTPQSGFAGQLPLQGSL